MAAKSQAKILLGVAALLVLASAGWTAFQASATKEASSSASATSRPYEATGVDAPVVSTSVWPAAPAQTSGSEWVFEVFTPPQIVYDNVTKRFDVKREKPPEPPPEPPKPFGIHLVEIRPDVFRLQLVGYVGSEGDYRGNFENTLSGRTIIGRAGKEFPDLGLKVKTFEVNRVKTTGSGSTPIIEMVATAVVVDVKTGDEVTLNNKKRHIQGLPYALLKADDMTEPVRKKAGEFIEHNGAKFTVVSITTEPPSAVVRKEAPDLKEPRTETLSPHVPPPAAVAEPAPQPAPAAPAQNTFPGLE